MANIFKKIGFVNGQTKANATTMNTLETNISNAIQDVLLAAHPIGSYYWSSNNTNPKDLFGGTWTQIKDRFILAAGDTYAVGTTGGEATHTLTLLEMPTHNHGLSNSNFASYHTQRDGNSNWEFGGNNYLSGGNTTTTDTGSGQAHNNMPPYLVAYCWRRTA